MSWGEDFAKAFFGADSLRDYTHASKSFTTNGYQLAPKAKFLFHVNFTLNTAELPALKAVFASSDQNEISLSVKTVQLPQFEVDVETLNQYNRKRLVQTKINYQPIQLTFNDDNSNLINTLWYNYYSYYYKDPSQMYGTGSANNMNGSIGVGGNYAPGFGYNTRDIYANDRPVNDWGYVGESYYDGTNSFSGKPAFFKDIRITGFNQHKYAQYILINPMITGWQHDTYDYSQGNGMMTNTMTMRYETVKYSTGALGNLRPDPSTGFADPAHYDTTLSPISRPGSRATVLGQGGLLDAGIGIFEDLQSGGVAGVIGAIQKAGTTYNTFKGKNLKAIVNEEANAALKGVIQQSLPGAVRSVIGAPGTGTTLPSAGSAGTVNGANGLFFPTPPRG